MQKINLTNLLFLIFILFGCNTTDKTVSTTTNVTGTTSTTIKYEKVIIYGDTRTNDNIHSQVTEQIYLKKADTIFHLGDFVEDGTNIDLWLNFNNISRKIRENTKFYTIIGNHDNTDKSKLYFLNFNLPENKKYYSHKINDLFFIILDSSYTSIEPASEQYNWLLDQLKSNTSYFMIVLLHHPIYNTGAHSNDLNVTMLKETLPVLFQKYNVKIVFSGHDHNYEKSFYNNIYYVVTGGGGAPLQNQIKNESYSQNFLSTYNFCEIVNSKDKVDIFVYDISGKVIDKIEISRTGY